MPYKLIPTCLSDVKILKPKIFHDDRGYFYESFNQKNFQDNFDQSIEFVQDNQSKSKKGVLRGLHYQINHPQGKLVRVVAGEIFDVAVDLRQSSADFGKWVGVVLSDKNNHQLWVPPGFAHGFLVISDYAEVLYKTTDYWYPEHERTLLWNDPKIGIDWPFLKNVHATKKDLTGNELYNAELFE
jgi:dTDP-4-dehydrorhamnose 3,5-epimerase